MSDFNFKNENTQDDLNKEERYLQFGLGKENYAVFLLDVKEVIPVPQMTVLPNSPSYYNGIMNLRGQIISVLDLRKKLSIQPIKEKQEEAVIIIEIDGIGIGLIVDSINKVLNVKSSEITEVPEISSQINSKYIQGIYQTETSLTVLLDLENVLNLKEIRNMQKSAA